MPTIHGALAVGGEVSVDQGLWQLDTDFRFQWYADGKAISGATDTSFVLTKAQLGKRLTVKAFGKYHAFPEISRISTATAKVTTAGTPTITGSPAVGSTLTAKPGTWNKKTKLSYQWLRNGKAISKATKASLQARRRGRRHLHLCARHRQAVRLRHSHEDQRSGADPGLILPKPNPGWAGRGPRPGTSPPE